MALDYALARLDAAIAIAKARVFRVRQPAAPGMVRLYHGTPHKGASNALRPSANGLSGPGINTSSALHHAAKYGPKIHSFDAPERGFVDWGAFNARSARNRSAAGAAREFEAQGFIGVRDGRVHTLWKNPNTGVRVPHPAKRRLRKAAIMLTKNALAELDEAILKASTRLKKSRGKRRKFS